MTTNDVVGVWSLIEDYGETRVTMTILASGEFKQELATSSLTNTHAGRWSLDGPHLRLDGFRQSVGSQPVTMHWYLVDGDKRLDIYGGAFPDPDAYQRLKYLRNAP